MPLTPKEPQIHESAPGRTASPRPIPGPRPTARPSDRPGPGGRSTAPSTGPSTPKPPPAPGPQLQLIPASVAGALDAADEAVDLLLDSGRSPGEILVLTTGDPHPWAVHELSFGEEAYWALQSGGDDVFYADASRVERAAKRPVIVVAVNGGNDLAAALVLSTAMARASALLVLCGEPARINALAGAAL